MTWKVVMPSKDLGFNYTDESFNELEVTFQHKDCQSEAEIMEFSREADAMIARGSSQPLPGSVISKLVNCRIIASLGVGYENLDVAAATEAGICVTNCADYCVEEVSDHTMAILLCCARRIFPSHSAWNDGQEERIVLRVRSGGICQPPLAVIAVKEGHTLGGPCSILRYNPNIEPHSLQVL